MKHGWKDHIGVVGTLPYLPEDRVTITGWYSGVNTDLRVISAGKVFLMLYASIGATATAVGSNYVYLNVNNAAGGLIYQVAALFMRDIETKNVVIPMHFPLEINAGEKINIAVTTNCGAMISIYGVERNV